MLSSTLSSSSRKSSKQSSSSASSSEIEERMEGGIRVWRKCGEKLEVENRAP